MRYRFLCCSDTHGQLPPALDENGAIAWLHAGDVTDGPASVASDSNPLLDPLRAEVAGWFDNRPLPIFVVKGNHDATDDFRAFASSRDLTGRVVQVAPHLFVAGLGWHGGRYYDLPGESDLSGVCQTVLRQARRLIMPRDRVILLTHYPAMVREASDFAAGADRAGVWYQCVRDVVEAMRPLAVVQGHVNRWFGKSLSLTTGGSSSLLFFPGPVGAALTIDVEAGTAEIDPVAVSRS